MQIWHYLGVGGITHFLGCVNEFCTWVFYFDDFYVWRPFQNKFFDFGHFWRFAAPKCENAQIFSEMGMKMTLSLWYMFCIAQNLVNILQIGLYVTRRSHMTSYIENSATLWFLPQKCIIFGQFLFQIFINSPNITLKCNYNFSWSHINLFGVYLPSSEQYRTCTTRKVSFSCPFR